MTANLTPQYQKAEQEYRRAQDADERVECLTRMLQLMPKHKGTEKLQADVKSRLKEAKSEQQTEKKSGKKGPSYRYPHQGAGQVILLGAPNAGKSRTLAELTRAEPAVAPFPFTTREPLPGMMPWEDATVQLIDTPPITDNHLEPYMINLVRAADAVALCMDGSSDDAPDETMAVISQFESRKTMLADATGFDEDDFSIVWLRTLLVVTRGDDPGCDDRLEYFREMHPHNFEVHCVEFDRDESKESLRTALYKAMQVIRIYTKRPGKPAEYESPFTIPVDGTVEQLALQIHRDIADNLNFAKVWGTSAHEGQSVGKEHQLHDKDLVEIHAKGF